jgi:hypothetical protein
MSFNYLQLFFYQILRTGASFFFNLDVTQRRSADAIEGLKDAMSAIRKLKTLSTKLIDQIRIV